MNFIGITAAFFLVLSWTFTSCANDINLSWSMATLKSQALTQTVKIAKNQKYLSINQSQSKRVWHLIIDLLDLKNSDD